MKTETKGKEFLEQIVTISAEEYCKMKGKELREYEPVGVIISEWLTYTNDEKHVKEYCNVPINTEIIVSAKTIIHEDQNLRMLLRYHGTALIPK